MSEEQNLAQSAAQAEDRLPRYTFTIPEKARRSTDPKVITLRDLLFAEEKTAMLAKEKGGHTFEYEGAMRSLYAVDGRKVTWANDEKQRTFEGLSPKVRDLVVSGFLKVVIPSKDDREDFLASVKVEIGE